VLVVILGIGFFARPDREEFGTTYDINRACHGPMPTLTCIKGTFLTASLLQEKLRFIESFTSATRFP
jgi:hypothetical protein